MKSVYPTTILGFFLYLVAVMAYLTANATRLGIASAKLTALAAIYGDVDIPDTYLYFKTLWDDATGSRTRLVKAGLRQKSKEMRKALSEIYNDIPASKWTSSDRETTNRKTGLVKPKETPTTPIVEVCIPDTVSLTNGQFSISTRSRFDKKHYAIPDTADMVEIMYAVIEGKRKVDETTDKKVLKVCDSWADTNNKELFTTAKFLVNVDPKFAGFDFKFWIRWTLASHRNLAGPWSGPHTHTIG